jgi:hypothetical protein
MEGDHVVDRSMSEDNIKMDLKEIGWEVVNWIYLAQEETNGGIL